MLDLVEIQYKWHGYWFPGAIEIISIGNIQQALQLKTTKSRYYDTCPKKIAENKNN